MSRRKKGPDSSDWSYIPVAVPFADLYRPAPPPPFGPGQGGPGGAPPGPPPQFEPQLPQQYGGGGAGGAFHGGPGGGFHGGGPGGFHPQDPHGIRFCLHRNVFIWPRFGRPFWAFPTNVSWNLVSGFRWRQRIGRWEPFTIPLQQISHYQCI
ncbi:hypothetical protein JJB07_17540 [Tumebacillus sp. ITR2]|uniref:Transporter n=1 Tax=Tumebacillus amylolyticus TaxID=2801339 RepID=A0ABS1JDN7_9BACL|nr:hypothetical protein [Tumebacillus amylolyticus]MBL0388412.1 hypothetical protein [Tumebacillus amylolyticus]